MERFAAIVALFAVCSVTGGCASIIRGTTQTIAISTPPAIGAVCDLSSPEGNWQIISPGVASVGKSKNNILIRCDKPGWNSAAASIPSNFEGWTFGNLLFGGLIGVGVDAATGAINEYPDSFQVPMTQSVATPQRSDPVSRLATPVAPRASACVSTPAVTAELQTRHLTADVAPHASTPAVNTPNWRTDAVPALLAHAQMDEPKVVLFPVTIYHRYHPSWHVDVQ
ncbi:MAG TPA: hypothetical protein VMF05_13370 [Stellaceae bacterium]|nr:hypothetical protein [Stellaceae bacterium]